MYRYSYDMYTPYPVCGVMPCLSRVHTQTEPECGVLVGVCERIIVYLLFSIIVYSYATTACALARQSKGSER
jgi:hypothetical protein